MKPGRRSVVIPLRVDETMSVALHYCHGEVVEVYRACAGSCGVYPSVCEMAVRVEDLLFDADRKPIPAIQWLEVKGPGPIRIEMPECGRARTVTCRLLQCGSLWSEPSWW